MWEWVIGAGLVGGLAGTVGTFWLHRHPGTAGAAEQTARGLYARLEADLTRRAAELEQDLGEMGVSLLQRTVQDCQPLVQQARKAAELAELAAAQAQASAARAADAAPPGVRTAAVPCPASGAPAPGEAGAGPASLPRTRKKSGNATATGDASNPTIKTRGTKKQRAARPLRSSAPAAHAPAATDPAVPAQAPAGALRAAAALDRSTTVPVQAEMTAAPPAASLPDQIIRAFRETGDIQQTAQRLGLQVGKVEALLKMVGEV